MEKTAPVLFLAVRVVLPTPSGGWSVARPRDETTELAFPQAGDKLEGYGFRTLVEVSVWPNVEGRRRPPGISCQAAVRGRGQRQYIRYRKAPRYARGVMPVANRKVRTKSTS